MPAQAGPFAQTAEDCALLLNAMAGFDPHDATSLDRPKEDYTRDLNKPLAGLRIGLPKEFFGDGVAPDIARAVDAALDVYRKLGATTVEISLPNVKYSVPAYYVVAPAEASSNAGTRSVPLRFARSRVPCNLAAQRTPVPSP